MILALRSLSLSHRPCGSASWESSSLHEARRGLRRDAFWALKAFFREEQKPRKSQKAWSTLVWQGICVLTIALIIRAQLQDWLSFLLSTIFHAQCNLILPDPKKHHIRGPNGLIDFSLLWQAFAISLEDTAVSRSLIRRTGLERIQWWAMAEKLVGRM